MAGRNSVRDLPVTSCAGDDAAFTAESPSFVYRLSDPQLSALSDHVLEHVWNGGCDPVDPVATWSPDLSAVEELLIQCSCGVRRTFDRHGREVIFNG